MQTHVAKNMTMIVLGPHIHHHNCHHVLAKDGDSTPAPDDDSSANRPYNAFRSSSNTDGGGTVDEDEERSNDRLQPLSDATAARSPLEVRCNNKLLQARVEISKLLGSTGAPPLISSVDCCFLGANENSRARHNSEEVVMNINTSQHTTEETVQAHLDSIVELAKSHTDLLQTMQSCLHMLTIGTGVRLGIGPNNIPGSRRAETAWLERKLRQHDTAIYKPRLTLHRCRQILHHAIVDQTTSLQSIVSRHGVHFDGITDWDDFVQDLKHTMECDCVLSLSRLRKWTDSIGKFLGGLLSELLSRSFRWKILLLEGTHPIDSFRTTIASSVQMARERIAFLQSAFSVPSSSATTSFEDDLAPASCNKDIPHMNNLIDVLKSNLEGAHVSLWAFEESRTRSTEYSESDWKNWFRELKDLVERTNITVSELDNLFLPRSDDAKSKDMADETLSDNAMDEHCTTPQSAMLVSDGASADELALHSSYETKQNVPMDKTLIFCGNGSHKRSQISKDKPARSPVKSQNMSHPPSFFNQTDLLRDLQSRLKTMGLAEEYEVVAATESSSDDEKTNVESRRSQSRHGADLPMFLGVSGSTLAELSSAMRNQQQLKGQEIIE